MVQSIQMTKRKVVKMMAQCMHTGDTHIAIPPVPGDLSRARHLAQSHRYTVEVRPQGGDSFRPCFVYETDNYAGNRFQTEHREQETASFACFSFEGGPVEVRITGQKDVGKCAVRPSAFGIHPIIDGNTVTLFMEIPRKISVEIGNRTNPLFLFADGIEEPDTEADHYFGPGFHEIGEHYTVHTGERVYIAQGAVVQGTLLIDENSEHVSIRGRGILNVGIKTPTNDCSWLAEHCTITAKANRGLTVEGIVLTNACAWTVCITDRRGWDMPRARKEDAEGSCGNVFRNLKLVSWCGNSDGIWFDGDQTVVEDCFIFNNDDGVTTHGSHHAQIRNIVYWGGYWGRFFMHSAWASSTDLTFEHIYVIGKDAGEAVILLCGDGEDRNITLSGFHFSDIHAEEFRCPMMQVSARNVQLTDIAFSQVHLYGQTEN